MSCNGCRVLRRGCSEKCPLRPCLDWIDSPKAQGNATLFVSKFFGRSDLMSFISAVPDSKKSALFQSLLYEACGRTVNPVNGAVGLLSTGNWHVCRSAVETVLAGGELRPKCGIEISSPELYEEADRFRNGSWRAKKSKAFFVRGSDDETMIKLDPEMSPPASEMENSELSASFGSGGCYDGVEINGVGGGKEPKLLNLFV